MYPYNEEPTQQYQTVGPAPRRSGGRMALAAALLVGVIGGGAAGGIVARSTEPAAVTKTVYVQSSSSAPASPADAIAQPPLRTVDASDRAVAVVKRVGPAVVTIQTSGTDPSTQQQFQASGSGVIIDSKGDILTNNHVIENGTSVKVIFQSGQSASATVVGSAAYTDLAVIHVDAKVPAWAPLGDSKNVQPGQTVLAIGSPLGDFHNTVTEGIISAVGRTLQEPNTTLTGVLQTDAAINHGNSGGPLVNLNGEVIGINTAVVRSSQDTGNGQDPNNPFNFFTTPSTTDPAQGLGFAIPSDTARQIIGRILLHLPPGYLGVGPGQTVDAQTATYYNLPVGVVVQSVSPGTPAAQAGIKPKDIITTVDGQQIDPNHDLRTVVEMHQPGQTVKIAVWRSGKTLTFNVKLAARPSNLK